jgi:hypothetical protein
VTDGGARTIEWTGGPEGLRLGALLVSFQRFARPVGDVVGRAPSSLGALPVAPGPSGFLLPLADDEAFWIGVIVPADPNPGALVLEVVFENGRTAPVTRLEKPGTVFIAGIGRSDGRFEAFCRPCIAGLYVSLGDHRTRVCLTEPTTYAEMSGCPRPEPLDPSAAYGGWRLP